VLGRLTADVANVASGNPKNVDTSVLRLDYAYDSAGRLYQLTSRSGTASGSTIVNQLQREYNGYGQLAVEYQEHGGAVTEPSPKMRYVYAGAAAAKCKPVVWARQRSELLYPRPRRPKLPSGDRRARREAACLTCGALSSA
jgi:hypothetical protein